MCYYTFTTEVQDGGALLTVTWRRPDQSEIITGEKLVLGGETAATSEAPFFAGDLKRNFAHLFPIPVTSPEPMEGGFE